MTRMVELHNQWRAEVGLGPVTWNQQLADGAQAWANGLAQGTVSGHDPNCCGGSWAGSGESISIGATAEAAAGVWYEEKQTYEEIAARGETLDGNHPDYFMFGHYLNILSFDHVGCGWAGDRLVCRYGRTSNP